MKFYNLYINCNEDIFNKITTLLDVCPKEHKDKSTWWYQVCEGDEDDSIDFSQIFETLLKPNMNKLASLGITNNDMLIWIVYEYFKQCSLSFQTIELQRLSDLNIALNIDCHEVETLT